MGVIDKLLYSNYYGVIMELTSTQEDYIETIYRMMDDENQGVRVSDLALKLGCRMPTVSRTVQFLTDSGFLEHAHRKAISLTEKGVLAACEIVHRHDDVVAFLGLVLGLPEDLAQADACQLEHGFSRLGAERLHRFLLYFEQMSVVERKKMQSFVMDQQADDVYQWLTRSKASGWRV